MPKIDELRTQINITQIYFLFWMMFFQKIIATI